MLLISKPINPVLIKAFWSWVDVRDVAEAHLKACQLSEAGGQRFLIVQGNYRDRRYSAEKVPETKDRVTVGKPDSGLGGIELYEVDNSKSQKVLGLKYHNLEQTIVDLARAFLELEKSS